MDLKKLNDQELKKLRRKVKDEANKHKIIQLALKEQLNSAFGALGNKYFRFYDTRQAEAITLSGQMLNFYIEKNLNRILNEVLGTTDKDFVIAADTDSWYLNLEELVRKVYPTETKENKQEIVSFVDKACKTKIQKIFDDHFDILSDKLNVYKRSISVKREAIADKGVWTAKKRYMLNVYDNEGVRYTEPKSIIKGLEAIKSETPEVCKIAIKEVFKIALNSDEADVQKYIAKFREEFNTFPPELIAKHMSVSFLNKYEVRSISTMPKGVPHNSKAALVYNFLLKEHGLTTTYPPINEGDKISIVELMVPNPCQQKKIAFPEALPREFGLHNFIDYDKQFEKVFLDPVNRIFNVMKWKAEENNNLLSLLQ